ncbi:NAD(P)/FAD-dependent oxidoreductase [Burkholderia multivorans]|uniref:phytoene desaturase family protein n=1 Tax=Burkholderia multivorans TaxID=87883 RepID=UPI000CFE62E5|nr:NAD(P)/FAD-dependent oxidoreductase [Burkholderia multivorans]MBU9312536.1 NAD(P)/FAD-dependent oxidoreductase [Burkholderia multivorans]MCA8250710.1 NAD(P)/FAD-dependent oxidoreductase [Burkholderia multivorans]MCA8457335.1 NAD(P)/FAD-dependent oxidoreductase [Burkholderia multivorans]MDN7870383.1 NAD(P)/FAD-dependent oxidoreductase [Burkholderia multivorans]PRE14892.1 NAD(P)/FAD-dependent oxidoreductase [Burkholderia multivorans]
MSTSQTHDVVIVGGGHNGLSAGCYLAAAGKKVLVLEALEKVGGMASSGYLLPEAPEHLIHPCALDMMSMRVHPRVPRELELERHGFRQVEMTPGYVYLHPDGTSLVFWRDPEKTAQEIRRYSPKDAESFLAFIKIVLAFIDMAVPMMRVDPAEGNLGARFEALRAALRNRRLKPELMALLTGSAYQAALEHFEHPVTISAMCALTGLAGPITADGSGIYYALLGFLHRFGVGRVVGGMQTLSNAMAARLRELGGEVLTSARVEEIVADERAVRGVRLADGRTFDARAVIASCHPQVALELVSPGRIDPRLLTRIRHAPANAHGASPLKLDMALRGQISLARFEAKRDDGLDLRKTCLLIGTAEAVLENFRASARGEVPTLPYLTLAAPSAIDPSQAPVGQDTVYIYPPAMPAHPREGWDAIRERVARQVIDQASEYVDGLKEFEIARRMEAAPDFTRRLNTVNGCVVHIDTTTMRSSKLRPAYGLGGATLPLPGLYFGGAGIHPGGGVNGMPGRIAAHRVQRWLGRNERRGTRALGVVAAVLGAWGIG